MPKAAKILDAEFTRYEQVLQRMMALGDVAAGQLLPYVRLTMPVPEAPDDVTRTQYDDQKFHRVMAVALEEVAFGRIRRLVISTPPRHGKACAHDTPVLTPSGWTTHGELKIGDQVFGPDGLPTTVLGLSADVDEVVPVTLSNGDVIRCHLNHEWTVFDRSRAQWRTLETKEIAAQKLYSGGRARFQLPDTLGVEFSPPTAPLPLHPYALGVWLGDGSAGSTRIAHAPEDVAPLDAIEALGYPRSGRFVQAETGVAYTVFEGARGVGSPFQQALKQLGVLHDKHIPEQYLRAPRPDRLQLLAGLVDTDGHVDLAGRVRFSTCSPALRDGVFDLAAALGYRPYLTEAAPALSSSGVQGRKPTFQVAFQPHEAIPVHLARKATTTFALRRRVGIVRVGELERAGARSICVAREDGLYLVGRKLNVTHNTEQAAKKFIPFYAGHNPGKSVIFGTYNDKFSQDVGRAVRDNILHPATRQAFPDLQLKVDSAASDRLETTKGGVLAFVGRGGTTTGRGADLFVIDDPFKDSAEADSPTIRENAWTWFNRVAGTRLMTDKGAIIIIGTRWHPDDIIGRLTDPTNDHYDPEEAETWRTIDFPALARESDALGRRPGEALWPSRFGVPFLRSLERRDPRGFSALYQGQPNPEGGTFFEDKWLKTYLPNELPNQLRIYAASDHAVSTARGSDKTCLMSVGVSEDDHIWVLPDLVWRTMNAEQAVENMLAMMRRHHPILWWAERGHISKSIGPFLRKRMLEEQVYCTVVEQATLGDKQTRAQSIQGRMSMGMVHWPARAPWWPEARNELLRFPHDAHDDLVDTISHIGMGLGQLMGAATFRPKNELRPGTFGWLKEQRRIAERAARSNSHGGW